MKNKILNFIQIEEMPQNSNKKPFAPVRLSKTSLLTVLESVWVTESSVLCARGHLLSHLLQRASWQQLSKLKTFAFTSINKTNKMNTLVLDQVHSLPRAYPTDVLTKSAHIHVVCTSIILYQRKTGNNINAHQWDVIQCIGLHTFRGMLSIEKKSLYILIEILPLYMDCTNSLYFLKCPRSLMLYHVHPLPCGWSLRAPQSPPNPLATPSHSPGTLAPGPV